MSRPASLKFLCSSYFRVTADECVRSRMQSESDSWTCDKIKFRARLACKRADVPMELLLLAEAQAGAGLYPNSASTSSCVTYPAAPSSRGPLIRLRPLVG